MSYCVPFTFDPPLAGLPQVRRSSGRAVENLLRPLVQALARQFGGQSDLAVNLGVDPEHGLARIDLLRLFADLGASFDVACDCFMEGFVWP